MKKLEYRFTNDMLFKALFVKHQDLLKKLVADLLGIKLRSIEQFAVASSDKLPEYIGDKFYRLDINMVLDGQRIDLEIQVANEGDYPERSLFYWASEYSSALDQGMDYIDLPRTIHISILGFKLFACKEFHSEFQALEVKRHEQLTDKMVLHYFELPKVPTQISPGDGLKLWLQLFKSETEEDLKQILATGVPAMGQAIDAYRKITGTDEFKEAERMRRRAMSNETAALRHAAEIERKKWQTKMAKKDDALAKMAAENAKLKAQLAKKK
jgi:predicted transposase/invertase (TIGR01784 family)